ncbi:MAG: sugar-transfer associated ATP-grasp domain-containing protein, partial [bacterium]|nr:sugar-transfer associated ATP-grasp domain-containing protein [bacterium]
HGVPDIRVIVYLGYPVMAMIRLPTQASGGRANLHQGAVGAGINMNTGTITTAIFHNHLIERHPDSQFSLKDLAVPHWRRLLTIAAECFEMAPLGYMGVDLVIDEELGPMILEMNARPGLSIQIANQRGLEGILRFFKTKIKPGLSGEERVELALELFKQMVPDALGQDLT